MQGVSRFAGQINMARCLLHRQTGRRAVQQRRTRALTEAGGGGGSWSEGPCGAVPRRGWSPAIRRWHFQWWRRRRRADVYSTSLVRAQCPSVRPSACNKVLISLQSTPTPPPSASLVDGVQLFSRWQTDGRTHRTHVVVILPPLRPPTSCTHQRIHLINLDIHSPHTVRVPCSFGGYVKQFSLQRGTHGLSWWGSDAPVNTSEGQRRSTKWS